MRKTVFTVLLLGTLICSMAVVAQTAAADIVVQTVTGKVEFEVSAGKWQAVTVGMKLAPTLLLNTGLNSSLVLKIGERIVTVKAMQKGTVEKLTSGTASAKGGIKIGAKVTETDATSKTEQGRTNISTASTRAADATKDVQWEE